MFSDLENLLKVPIITVLGLIVQVVLQYKVGATPENFREVYAAGLVLPIRGVSGWHLYTTHARGDTSA